MINKEFVLKSENSKKYDELVNEETDFNDLLDFFKYSQSTIIVEDPIIYLEENLEENSFTESNISIPQSEQLEQEETLVSLSDEEIIYEPLTSSNNYEDESSSDSSMS